MAPSTLAHRDGSSSRPYVALAILTALLAFSIDAMFKQLERNGYMDAVNPLMYENKPALLPGTNRPILRHYTGIAGLDQVYVVANVFWANIVDGSLPECTLYAFQFGGQLPAVLIILLAESRRVAGPHTLLRSLAFWGMALQTFGFGVVMPLWTILYFALPRRAPTSSEAALLREPILMHAVIPAFILGYFFPTTLLVYPYDDAAWRQRANIFWQYIPVYVAVLVEIFTWVSKRTAIGQNINQSSKQLSRNALSHAYGFALTVAAIFQWLTYGALLAAYVFSDQLPHGLAGRLTPTSLFVPSPPHSFNKMESPATAIHDFMIYDQYFGSTAIAIWAFFLSREAGAGQVSITQVLRDSILVGPAAAAMKILWTRDETLLAKA